MDVRHVLYSKNVRPVLRCACSQALTFYGHWTLFPAEARCHETYFLVNPYYILLQEIGSFPITQAISSFCQNYYIGAEQAHASRFCSLPCMCVGGGGGVIEWLTVSPNLKRGKENAQMIKT